MTVTAGRNRNQGKTMFVKEVVHDNPKANHQAVVEAWRAAGMRGTISATLVNKMRSRLGLAGNLRGGRRRGTGSASTGNAGSAYTGKRRGRPPKQGVSHGNGTTQVRT